MGRLNQGKEKEGVGKRTQKERVGNQPQDLLPQRTCKLGKVHTLLIAAMLVRHSDARLAEHSN